MTRLLPVVILIFMPMFVLASEPNGKEIRWLIMALDDANIRQGASIALANLGQPAVPALRTSLTSERTDLRLWSAYTLGQIGPVAESAVEALNVSLADTDPALRAAAAQALGKIAAPAAVDCLINALDDENDQVRQNAAVALGQIGSAASRATKKLIVALSDQQVRTIARDALMQMGPDTVDPLVESLDHDNIRFDVLVVLWDHFLAAVSAARDSNTWVMIHIGECPMTLPEMMPHLQSGDCITHCFKAGSTTLLDPQQQVFEEIRQAADQGIVFDVGHGFGSFQWEVATACLEQGFEPTTISTDLHLKNVHGPVYDMPTTMSKFLMLGLSLERVFAMSTIHPARVLHRESEIGTLRIGSRADIALFELNQGEYVFTDSYEQTRTGHEKLSAVGIVQRGQLHMNSNRMS